MPHTTLIEGEKGSGRKAFAKQLASAILCEAQESRPCGTCRHCVKMAKDIHPDFETVEGSGGTRSFHVDAVREMRRDAYVSPNEASARVFLLLDAQTMSVQAQNALLKIIEEPPPGVYFILVCENRGQMLPTIRSRAAAVTVESTGTDDKLRGDDGYPAAAQAFRALTEGDDYSTLAYFCDVERDREGFISRLELLRGVAAGLRAMEIIDIIDSVREAAAGNGSISLLTVSLCCQIKTIGR
ncbi:MAG: hypothetical protein FWH00_02425 [Oscillospiraceae bacterium]|nr:hypothetical protein [Oscillospiraceae bacterium]